MGGALVFLPSKLESSTSVMGVHDSKRVIEVEGGERLVPCGACTDRSEDSVDPAVSLDRDVDSHPLELEVGEAVAGDADALAGEVAVPVEACSGAIEDRIGAEFFVPAALGASGIHPLALERMPGAIL